MIIIIGIYSITNTINGKKYIGHSTNIKQRWNYHKTYLKNNEHDNQHLQDDYNKFGASAFEYELVEECEESKLDEREVYWISVYDSKNNGYNMTIGGKGLLNPTDDVKEKISNGLKGERNGMYNVHLCGELNGNYGKHHSESAKAKMSEKAKLRTSEKSGRHRPVQASTGEIFYVMLDAIKWANLKDGSSIGKCCKGVAKTAGCHPVTKEKLSWKYRDDLK